MAGELATKAGVTGWPKLVANEAAHLALGDWLERRRDGRARVQDRLEDLQSYVAANLNRFVDLSDSSQEVPQNVLGWHDNERLYLSSSGWQELFPGQTAVVAAPQMRKAGLLFSEDGKNLAQKASRSVHGRPRVYVLKKSSLSDVLVLSDKCELVCVCPTHAGRQAARRPRHSSRAAARLAL